MPEPTLIVIFVTSFLVGLSGALTPGPLLAVNITESSRRGFWAGPSLTLGHGVLELALVLALAQGLNRLLDRELVGAAIGLVGGSFLVGLGLLTVKNARQARVAFGASSKAASPRLAVPLAGALASLANPFWILWWATIGTSYVLWSLKLGTPGLASFYSGHILADLGWYSLVSGLIAGGRRWLRDSVYRALMAGCGLFLVGMGGYFLASGLGTLV